MSAVHTTGLYTDEERAFGRTSLSLQAMFDVAAARYNRVYPEVCVQIALVNTSLDLGDDGCTIEDFCALIHLGELIGSIDPEVAYHYFPRKIRRSLQAPVEAPALATPASAGAAGSSGDLPFEPPLSPPSGLPPPPPPPPAAPPVFTAFEQAPPPCPMYDISDDVECVAFPPPSEPDEDGAAL
jgi:hypothetical protein